MKAFVVSVDDDAAGADADAAQAPAGAAARRGCAQVSRDEHRAGDEARLVGQGSAATSSDAAAKATIRSSQFSGPRR